MSLHAYTMNKDLNIFARWFSDFENHDHLVNGQLSYTRTSIILEVDQPLNSTMVNNVDTKRHLYGISSEGFLIVLNHCVKIEASPEASIENTITYSVESFYLFTDQRLKLKEFFSKPSLFIKQLPRLHETYQIEKIQFSLNRLEQWLTVAEPVKFTIQSQEIVLAFKQIGRENTIPSLNKGRYWLEITAKNNTPKECRYFFEQVSQIKNLIEFLCNTSLSYNDIEFLLPIAQSEATLKIKGRCFFKQTDKQKNQLPHHVLNLNKIEKEFATILDNWFLKEKKFSFIIDNYLNDLSLDYYIETKVVNSIRNLEVFYRNFISDPHFIAQKRKELAREQQLLIDFVKKEISSVHHPHFIQNILYVGEESLRTKLNYLIKNLPQSVFHTFIQQKEKSPSKSRNGFVHMLIDTRNFYTHGDVKEKYPHRIQGTQNFLIVNEQLKIIQRYYLFKELGLTEEFIMDILSAEMNNVLKLKGRSR